MYWPRLFDLNGGGSPASQVDELAVMVSTCLSFMIHTYRSRVATKWLYDTSIKIDAGISISW